MVRTHFLLNTIPLVTEGKAGEGYEPWYKVLLLCISERTGQPVPSLLAFKDLISFVITCDGYV